MTDDSRGRSQGHHGDFQLSGRGGIGNRSISRGRPPPTISTTPAGATTVDGNVNDESNATVVQARATSGSRERSSSRGGGREFGRGGAGNRIRSVSRGPNGSRERGATVVEEEKLKKEEEEVKRLDEEEEQVEAEYKKKGHHHLASGRGGFGNVH